jgi:superfamily I DNA and/or RNA helicase
MGIIFIDFQKNLTDVKTNKHSFFCYSLEEQFQSIKSRIPTHKNQCNNLKDFIEQCFPTALTKKYYFTSSNFKREQKENSNGTTFLENIVIRPEMTMEMKNYLPDKYNIILIGDISENDKYKVFIVKGIELIDEFVSSTNDIQVLDSYCTHTFGMGLSYYGKPYTKWTIDNPQHELSIFTPDFIANLIKNCYPMSISSVEEVIETNEKWQEYINFRNQYLVSQTQRFFPISQIESITAHSINRQTYSRNASQYDDDLFVAHEDFKKGEQILLKTPTLESEEINLLAVHIDYNRKEFQFNIETDKRGRSFNPNEKILRIMSRENVALCKVMPTLETYEKLLKDSVSLDERYKLIVQDIEPNCDDITKKYGEIAKQQVNAIQERYQIIINHELDTLKRQEKQRLDVQLTEKLNTIKADYLNNIDSILVNNDDQDIIKQVKQIINQKNNELNQELKIKINNINKNQKDKDSLVKSLTQEKDSKLESFKLNINLRQFYDAKFERMKEQFTKDTQSKNAKLIQSYEQAKKQEITSKYSNQIILDSDKKKVELEEQRDKEITEKINNETIKRFSIYYKINSDNPNQSNQNLSAYRWLIYDYIAEKAKIKRQENALKNFFEGNVKNPYLATYLFAPKELKKNYYDYTDWKWFLESLNDNQKLAVQRAVASKGIFLLQGPPGTGKTQVIAEIVGHMVQEGKKVLVASETHKAIDNVFERLPLLADIRPLRLIPTKSNKSSNFGPENLVDNFYDNISKNMRNVIRTYEKFSEYRENFFETYQKQKALSDRISINKSLIDKTDKDIQKLNNRIDDFKKQRQIQVDEIDMFLVQNDQQLRTRRHLERANLTIDDDIDTKVIRDFIYQSTKCVSKENMFNLGMVSELIRQLLIIDMKTVSEEINAIISSTDEMKIQQEIAIIKSQIARYQDEFGDWHPNTEHLRKPLQERLRDLRANNSTGIVLEELKISKIFMLQYLDNPIPLKSVIEKYRTDLIEIRNSHFNMIDRNVEEINRKINILRSKVSSIEKDMNTIGEEIRLLQDDVDYQSVQEDETRLRREIAKFIEEFNVAIDYKNYQEAIGKIYQEYLDLDRNFKQKEENNKQVIPIFKKISDYLLKDEIREADRHKYTKPLFDKVNLFGITNTSRDNFDKSSMSDLEKYNLGKIDLKQQGIDVVIIDEVSKSSFLDLLIPILYGKTVILVGDHRQLPPMYEFRNLRQDDFNNIDESILTQGKNDKFKLLYEESFFKVLFEMVPEDYKVMLNQQYRSHEHIMEVYNCFYNHKLQLGKKAQNSEKEHHLSIISNHRKIIEPKKHVYFVDCKKFESKETDSTSIYNSNEADVVVELLRQINDSYKTHPNFKPEISKDKDGRMSVGVICTYGDQARVIKQKLKNGKIRLGMFNDKPDARMIISTVDDFQGDERDIIILSMVRNPQNRAKSDPGFVTAYQRINVALSRARRLLIVVGNRSYLEDKGVIDLPDVDGKGKDQKNFYVYKEVIGAINRYGTVFDDEDVLSGGKQ